MASPIVTANGQPTSPSSVGTMGPPSASLTYNNIRANGLGDLGQFRTMKDKFGWRIRKAVTGIDPTSRKTIQYDGTDVTSASWICIGPREFGIKIIMNDGDILRFDGFKESDFDSVQKHIKQYWKIELQKSRISTKGWHWGKGQIIGKQFSLNVDNRPTFDLHSKNIRHVSATKGDVTVVLHNDDLRSEAEDQLLELRLFIPPSKTGDDEGTNTFKEALLSLPGSQSVPLLLSVCSFSDIKVLVPAGRFDIQVTRTSIKLQGKSNDFTIDFKSIIQMFLLHSPSSPHVNLVLRLSSPLRKGHTPYFNVVIQFDDKKIIDLELGLNAEDLSTIESTNPSSFKTDLSVSMTGCEYDIASRILKALVGKDIIVPETFQSSTGQPCFRSSYKADTGNFYPLEKSFVFIPKPVIIIKYDDIVSVSFGRTSGAQTKLCEFDVVIKGGQTFSFSSVDRQESGPFIEFLQKKDICVRSFRPDDAVETENQSILDRDLPSDDESDDEDFQANSSDGDESFDDEEEEEDENDEEDDGDDDKKKKLPSSHLEVTHAKKQKRSSD